MGLARADIGASDWSRDRRRTHGARKMLSIVRRLWCVLFPFQRCGTPVDYANRTLDLPEHKDRVAALVAAATAVADETRMKEFRDIANAKSADEATRHTSILTRAQS